MPPVPYVDRDGRTTQLDFYEHMMKLNRDCSFDGLSPMNVVFPVLVHMNIGTRNRVNTRNNDAWIKALTEYLQNSGETESVYHRIVAQGDIDRDTVQRDTVSFLFGGHETTSKAFISALYFLKKEPRTLAKLLDELHEKLLGGNPAAARDLDSILTTEKLGELEYLTMVVKETLRIEPPGARSLGYKAKKDVVLGDVHVRRNQLIVFNLLGAHYSPHVWQRPKEFIPERFDPASEFYTAPDGGARHPLGNVPFSFGLRGCPGQVLAMLELKCLLANFLLKADYEVDADLLAQEDVSFAMLSPVEMFVSIKRKSF